MGGGDLSGCQQGESGGEGHSFSGRDTNIDGRFQVMEGGYMIGIFEGVEYLTGEG